MSKSSTKKIHKSKRTKRYYGLEVLKGQKFAWLSQQNKHGYSLGLALNSRTVWLRNIRFATRKDVENAMQKAKLVFINLKGTK